MRTDVGAGHTCLRDLQPEFSQLLLTILLAASGIPHLYASVPATGGFLTLQRAPVHLCLWASGAAERAFRCPAKTALHSMMNDCWPKSSPASVSQHHAMSIRPRLFGLKKDERKGKGYASHEAACIEEMFSNKQASKGITKLEGFQGDT
eukprot:1156062-Pelagomonas_calceolata.AAC.7